MKYKIPENSRIVLYPIAGYVRIRQPQQTPRHGVGAL